MTLRGLGRGGWGIRETTVHESYLKTEEKKKDISVQFENFKQNQLSNNLN